MAEALKDKALPIETPVEIWFQDEMRVGQKNGLVYQWAKKGTRPRQPKDQRYANAYLFGAVCPARDTGAALVLPYADTWAMQQHLSEISRHVSAGAHAVLILDKAGWHTTKKLRLPANITPLHLPAASPELNPIEAGLRWVSVHEVWYYAPLGFRMGVPPCNSAIEAAKASRVKATSASVCASEM